MNVPSCPRIAKSLAEVTEARRFAIREPKRSSARHASREGDVLVGAAGIEPATTCSQSRYATAALRPEDADYPIVARIATDLDLLEYRYVSGHEQAPGHDPQGDRQTLRHPTRR